MNGRRILIAGGMLLILSGLLYAGVFLSLYAGPLIKTAVSDIELALDYGARGQTYMARGYGNAWVKVQRQILLNGLVPAHLVSAGLIAITISSFIGTLELKKKWEKILSALLIVGGLFSGMGFFLQAVGFQLVGGGTTLLGYVWMLAGLVGYLICVALYIATKSVDK